MSLFDVSLDMLCIRDMQGRFVKLNRAWETTLGYPVGDLEGAALLPLIHPGDVAPTRSHMAHADLDGEILGFVNRYRRRDGCYRHLEWRARRIQGVMFGVARDVTERLAAEAKLRAEAEARRELLAEIDREIRKSLTGGVGVISALCRTELTPGPARDGPAHRELWREARTTGLGRARHGSIRRARTRTVAPYADVGFAPVSGRSAGMSGPALLALVGHSEGPTSGRGLVRRHGS